MASVRPARAVRAPGRLGRGGGVLHRLPGDLSDVSDHDQLRHHLRVAGGHRHPDAGPAGAAHSWSLRPLGALRSDPAGHDRRRPQRTAPLAIGVAILAALVAGALVGLINGAFILVFRIDSIIVTLGSGTFVGGVVLLISGSNTISGVSQHLVDWVIVKRLLGIPLEFYYGLLLCLVMWYVFELTPLGRRLLFVGRGRSVARLSGINVSRVRLGALVTSGVVSAVAGVAYAGTTGAADPTSGEQLLLPAFAAAFLGATTIVPGRFNPFGSLVAVYFLVTGITGFQLLGAQSYVQSLFYGGALVIAVALSQIARRRQIGRA